MSRRNFGDNGMLRRQSKTLAGFSLIELMVAMAVFLVVGGAAVALMRAHVPLFNTAQNQTGLNIALRNAVAQMQMEVVNAGTGNAGAVGTGFSPVGVTISKAATPNCNKAVPVVYSSACFDSFSLISVDTTLPLMTPSGDVTKTPIPSADTNSGAAWLTIPNGTAAAYTALAGSLKTNTELMFVQGGTGVPSMTIVVLTSDATPQTNSVQISFAGTTSDSACQEYQNGTPVTIVPPITGVPSADNLGIYNPRAEPNECPRFTGTFNPGIDYVIKLVSTASYQVDGSDPTNPKLVRKNIVTGLSDVIAEQIVGFTVGAWSSEILDPVLHVPAPGYTEDPSTFNDDWASIRSLHVQIVARATPGTDGANMNFNNSYDNGNYPVQGMSVVINPRNMNTN